MKKYGTYTWMAVGGAAGIGVALLLPGVNVGAGVAIGVAAGLAGSSEGFNCRMPWHSDDEEGSDEPRAE